MITEIHKIRLFVLLSLVVLVVPTIVFAHQPRITRSRYTVVPDPEISKAYYGSLTGESDVYTIQAAKPFNLYVNVLVPDIAGQKKDVSAVIFKNEKEIAVLEGINFEWKNFYEPFGADSYWMGPEYKARVDAGRYEIRVWSSNNDSKYSLAIGEIEAFDFKETVNALTIIPQLKKNFFEVSPITFIKSPFGYGLIAVMYILAFVAGFLYRLVMKKFSQGTVRGISKNIGFKDRIIRLVIAVVLLFFAITTSWSPLLLFFSGFTLFEAIFSWCGFYAALGKNTCPV
jgi:hypothetical protein